VSANLTRATNFMSTILDDYVALNLGYDLTTDSAVVELGGYKGNWSYRILEKHRPKVYHLFEPVPDFMRECRASLSKFTQVVYHQVAVGDKDGECAINIDNDSTSTFTPASSKVITIQTVSVDTFLHLIPASVQLLGINCEGGEYHLLEQLVETGEIQRFRDIQVQFHGCVPNSGPRSTAIREALAKTHTKTFDWATVWENWRIRS
jgi:FkbM family methyltransferase